MNFIKNIFKRIKDKINNFVNEMAQENKKAFGKKKLDCCDLNKKNGHNH